MHNQYLQAQLYPNPETKVLQSETPEQHVPLDPSVMLKQRDPEEMHDEDAAAVVATVVVAAAVVVSPAQL